ncbi:hypothetical protein BHE74_00025981 [Ensete ventricosum]|nr:hypothetical protein BHE74_00025981 [Ensete ventricosum]
MVVAEGDGAARSDYGSKQVRLRLRKQGKEEVTMVAAWKVACGHEGRMMAAMTAVDGSCDKATIEGCNNEGRRMVAGQRLWRGRKRGGRWILAATGGGEERKKG